MKTPHFLRLAEIDDTRSISGCRHGLVHVSWGRVTIRFARDEFRRLADLLERASDSPGQSRLQDGELAVMYRPDGECRVRAGAGVLLLSPEEYYELERAARAAVERLDKILSSGIWEREEPAGDGQDFWEPLRRSPFSDN